jgi:hypothetical protein
MRRFLKFISITTAAVLAAVGVYVALTLPQRALTFASSAKDGQLVWGAYHVHSTRSDGSGSVDDIAAAAARAGLHFVIFTDHGDATRMEAPVYRSGVLCIDAVEINTEAGHVVALSLERPSPYPLAGEAADVIEDIHRLGGWAIAAHPDSPRPALRWRAQATGLDGFEWFNVDSEWRAHGNGRLFAAGLRSLIRAPEAIATLFEAPRSFERWDGPGRPSLFSLAALDAHARIGSDSDGAAGRAAIRWPAYSSLFRTAAQAVQIETPFTGDPQRDSRLVLAAIRGRRSYSIVRAFADGLAPYRLVVSTRDGASSSGFMFPASEVTQLSGEVPGGPETEVLLLRDGAPIATAKGRVNQAGPLPPGRYRLEARLPGRRFPWMVSDVVELIGEPPPPAAATGVESSAAATLGPVVPRSDWRIEKDPTSTGTIDAGENEIALDYRLGAGSPAGQYVALAAPAGSDPIERIEFMGSSRAPMRISLQVRVAGGPDGQRWRRSIYLDEFPRKIAVSLSSLLPVDRRSTLRPIVARVQSVLVVIDTVNTAPGSAGRIMLREVRFVRGLERGQTARRP